MSLIDVAIIRYLLFALTKVLHNRRSPWHERSLIREPLRKELRHANLSEFPAMRFNISGKAQRVIPRKVFPQVRCRAVRALQ